MPCFPVSHFSSIIFSEPFCDLNSPSVASRRVYDLSMYNQYLLSLPILLPQTSSGTDPWKCDIAVRCQTKLPRVMTVRRGCFSFSSVSPTSIEMLSKVTVTVVLFSEQAPLLPNIKPEVVALPGSSAVLVPSVQVLYSTVVRSIPESSCKIRFKPSCV